MYPETPVYVLLQLLPSLSHPHVTLLLRHLREKASARQCLRLVRMDFCQWRINSHGHPQQQHSRQQARALWINSISHGKELPVEIGLAKKNSGTEMINNPNDQLHSCQHRSGGWENTGVHLWGSQIDRTETEIIPVQTTNSKHSRNKKNLSSATLSQPRKDHDEEE